MVEIFAEEHVLARPDEPPVGFAISSETAPGFVEIIMWGAGKRLRARFSGEDAVNCGATTILSAGRALAIAAGQQPVEQPRIMVAR